MEPEFWYICPMFFIPAAILRACINVFCEDHHISDRIAMRYGWNKHTVQKLQERIAGVISLCVTFLILIVVYYLLLKLKIIK